MSQTLKIRRGAVSGIPTAAAGEPLFTTDQFRLHVGSAGGNRLLGLLEKISAAVAPGVNDDAGAGYSVGSEWTDTAHAATYKCVDSTVGAAVWKQTGGDYLQTPLVVDVEDAATTTVSDALTLKHNSSGTPGAGFGIDVHFKQKSTTTVDRDAALIESTWTDATDATRKGALNLYCFEGSAARRVVDCGIGASGGPAIGFLNTARSPQLASPDVGTALTTFGFASGTPTFAAANLTGTVGETHGGTNQNAYTLGDTLYSSASNTLAKLAGNTTSTKKFLRQTGTGSVSAAPAWDTIAAADVPTFVAAGGSHAAGAVPDPGATAHTNEPYYLGDDAAFHVARGAALHDEFVATSETTTSTTGADLTTVQSFTFTVDVVGATYVVAVSATTSSNTANAVNRLYVNVNGGKTIVAQFTCAATATNYNEACVCYTVTGLGTGAQTISLQFGTNAGTATFLNRGFRVWRGPS